jgi:hypothetical protein
MNSKWFWGVLLVPATLLGTSDAGAQLAIQPAYVEVELDHGRATGTMTVTNTADNPVRLRAQAVMFAFDERGQMQQRPTEDAFSIAPMLKFNPREFVVEGKSSRTVRFSVIGTPDMEPGEYWAALEFEPLEQNSVSAEEDGRSVSINIRSAIIIPVYAWAGERTHQADFLNLKATKGEEGIEVEATMANTGTGHLVVQAEYDVLDEGGATLASGVIGRQIVLRETRRIFEGKIADVDPREGLRIRVRLRAKQFEEVLTGETPLDLSATGE